jgi:hypothetical protein
MTQQPWRNMIPNLINAGAALMGLSLVACLLLPSKPDFSRPLHIALLWTGIVSFAAGAAAVLLAASLWLIREIRRIQRHH